MWGRSGIKRVWLIVCGLAALAALAGLAPSVASAHTEFESSTPADGSTVILRPEAITITFTSRAEIVGDGVRLLDADAQAIAADVARTHDGEVITLRPRRPLRNGRYGVQWDVAGTDGHTLSGAFQFRVDAPGAVSSAAHRLVSNAAARGGAAAAPATTAAVTTSGATTAAVTTAAVTTAAVTTVAPTTTAPATSATIATTVAAAPTTSDPLDAVLTAGDNDRSGPGWAALGRVFLLLGVLVALGAATVANYVVTEPADRSTVLGWVRWAGVPVIVGTVIDALGQAGSIGGVTDSLDDVLSEWFGVAVALRLLGALCLLVLVRRYTSGPGIVLVPTAALVGIGALVLSFSFDGHTVSRGFPPLHAVVNIVHVTAAAMWAGSVIVVAALVVHRIRKGRPSDVLLLSLRLSGIATVAFGALLIAGVLLTIMVVNSFDDLLDTDWGLTLLLKVAAVAIALAFAVYNRLTLLPKLQSSPGDRKRRASVRAVITAEAIAMVLVVVTNAWLVAAAT